MSGLHCSYIGAARLNRIGPLAKQASRGVLFQLWGQQSLRAGLSNCALNFLYDVNTLVALVTKGAIFKGTVHMLTSTFTTPRPYTPIIINQTHTPSPKAKAGREKKCLLGPEMIGRFTLAARLSLIKLSQGSLGSQFVSGLVLLKR